MSPSPTLDASGRVPLTWRRGISTFGIGVIGFMAANLVPFMIIALVDGHSLTPTAAGTVMTACLLSTAVGCLLTSRWSARSGRYVVARGGLFLAAAGFGAAALVPVTPVAIAAIILGGLGGGGAISASGAALAALRNPNRMSGISGLANRAIVTVVLALIPLFGTGMLSAFGILALLALAFVLTSGWMPAAAAAPDATSASGPTVGADVGQSPAVPRKAPLLVTIAGFSLLSCFGLWALGEDSLWAVAGSMGAEQTGISDADMGLMLSISTAGGLVFGAIASYLGDRLGRTVPLLVLLLLGGGLKLAAGLVNDPGTYMLVIIAWNTVYALAFMYVVSVAVALDVRGFWSAALSGTYLIGSAFSPLFGTFIAETLGYVPLTAILSGFSFLLLVPFLVISRVAARVEKEGAAVSAPDSSDAAQFNQAAIV
ncbi:MFS transporter [Arthrobacter celericrescens]|uniref:MFS transporter n=1 Tax=Arthrobacter celericrescens TaxID=2320851 RepID=UPI0019693A92|nr:MFS transporter [Arthrobacter celericrescens]